MNASVAAVAATARLQPSTTVRLRGAWLWAARVGWVAIVITAVAIYAAAAPVAFDYLRTPCAQSPCSEPFKSSPSTANAVEDQYGVTLEIGAWSHTVQEAIVRLVTLGVGMLIFWRRSDDVTALIASIMLVASFAALSPSPDILARLQPSWNPPLTILRVIGLAATVSLIYLFPDGRFNPRWTRWLAVALLVMIGVLAATSALSQAGFPLFILAMATGAVVQVYRYRRVYDPLQRQQTKWVVLGVIGMAVSMAIFFVFAYLNPSLNPMMGPLSVQGTMIFSIMVTLCLVIPFTFLPVTLAISILRYRLWDVDIVINRALVYGTLTTLIVATYILVVGSLGALLQARGSLGVSLIGVGLVALIVQLVRDRIQRGVNRLMYGERDDPYAVLSRLGQRLEATAAPGAMLSMLVETVAQSLKLPYAAIAMGSAEDASVAASYGQPVAQMENFPLVFQAETIGQLIVGSRAPGESFNPTEKHLLINIAHQAGAAVHAVRLTADLQRSRHRLVTAREEERRRLRRDLHDGLGPQLASQMLTLDAIDRLLKRDPAGARRLLAELKAQSQNAVADIRRLIYGLRPPALDDLGLVAALRQDCAQVRQSGLKITVHVPEPLPELPAAVEVAAYRIAQEAITNVGRHAHAQRCQVYLTLENNRQHEKLCLEVHDDGCGLPAHQQAGIGFQSMRERAEELGGDWMIDSKPGKGTRVVAAFPLYHQDR